MEMSQAAIKNDDTDIKCFMVVKLSDNKVYLKHTTDQTDQTDYAVYSSHLNEMPEKEVRIINKTIHQDKLIAIKDKEYAFLVFVGINYPIDVAISLAEQHHKLTSDLMYQKSDSVMSPKERYEIICQGLEKESRTVGSKQHLPTRLLRQG